MQADTHTPCAAPFHVSLPSNYRIAPPHLQPRVLPQQPIVLLRQLGLLHQQGLHLSSHLLRCQRVGQRGVCPRWQAPRLELAVLLLQLAGLAAGLLQLPLQLVLLLKVRFERDADVVGQLAGDERPERRQK